MKKLLFLGLVIGPNIFVLFLFCFNLWFHRVGWSIAMGISFTVTSGLNLHSVIRIAQSTAFKDGVLRGLDLFVVDKEFTQRAPPPQMPRA